MRRSDRITRSEWRKRSAAARARAATRGAKFPGDTPEKRVQRMARGIVRPEHFNTQYLGHYFRSAPAPFHLLLYLALEQHRRNAVRAPRGHAKSTVITFADSLRQAVCSEVLYHWERGTLEQHDPELYAAVVAELGELTAERIAQWEAELAAEDDLVKRAALQERGPLTPKLHWDPYIQIISVNLDQASEFTESIKIELEENERLRSDWGVQVDDPGHNYEDFIVGARRPGYIGTRIKAFGMRKGIRGGKHGPYRPTLAIFDDPDSEETTGSEGVRTKQLKKLTAGVNYGLEPGKSRVFVVGTPVHAEAMVCELTREDRFPRWNKLRFKAITDDGLPLWWQRWGESVEAALEALAEERREDPESFDQEMMDMPPAEGDKPFPVLHYVGPSWQDQVVASCRGFDPSLAKTKKSDFQGLARVNLLKDGTQLVSEMEAWRISDYSLLVSRLNTVALQDPTDTQIIEAIGFQLLLEHMLAVDAKARGILQGWITIEHHEEGKDLRIRSLAGPVRRKRLLFADHLEDGEGARQFLRYPNGKRDLPDIVHMCVRHLNQYGDGKPWQQVRHSARPHASAMRTGHW